MPPIFRLEDWNEDAGQSTIQEPAVMHKAAAGLLYCCPGAGGSAVFPVQKRENGEETGNISPVPVSLSGAGVYGAEEENVYTIYALFYAVSLLENYFKERIQKKQLPACTGVAECSSAISYRAADACVCEEKAPCGAVRFLLQSDDRDAAAGAEERLL